MSFSWIAGWRRTTIPPEAGIPCVLQGSGGGLANSGVKNDW
jgi:hypothetical protein